MIEPDELFERLQGYTISTIPTHALNVVRCLGCERMLPPSEALFLVRPTRGYLCRDCKATLEEYDMEDAL
jgi:hypothetical protein